MFTTLWYDVEPLSWGSAAENRFVKHGSVIMLDPCHPRAFIQKMVDTGKSLGISDGIYSIWSSWSEIVGNWDYPASQGLPVWYPHYDNNPSFSDFRTFGGAKLPYALSDAFHHVSCRLDSASD